MRRLTDNDKVWGPFIWAKWTNTISLKLMSAGDDEDDEREDYNLIRIILFGRVLQIKIPTIIKPYKEKVQVITWDEETVKRLGRDWYYKVYPRVYGFSLHNMGAGYDFFQLFYGIKSHDSSTEQSWSRHLDWKMWDCVRSSVYNPDGTHFATEERGGGSEKFFEFCRIKEKCPTSKFLIEDYDGKKIVATCMVEEREWHRGTGWFKCLKYFYPAKIRRSLDIDFSEEVGPEKGSWKGGMMGHGIDMLKDETPIEAFKRYCNLEKCAKYSEKYKIKFLGVYNE